MGLRTNAKHIKSKYKYVNGSLKNGIMYYNARIIGQYRQNFKTEREAAIAIDKYLISQGKDPVNILIKK